MTEDIPLEITSREMANLPIFIAALIVAAVIARICVSVKRKEQPPVFRALWCATLLIPLGVVTAWIANQLLVNEGNSLWILSYSALGAAAVALLVEPLVSELINQTDVATGTVACICRDIIIIAAVAILSFVSLEIACNETFYRIPANSFGFSVGLLASILLSLYLLGQRHGGAMVLVPVACCILGIDEHFVMTFKGEAILPSDILALGTAMEVSEGYEFTFTAGIVTSLALLEISLGLLSLIRPRKLSTPAHVLPAIAGNLCAFLLVSVISLLGFSSIDLEQALNFGFDRWQPICTYVSQGFITSFTEMVNELPIEKPEGYTPDETKNIEQELVVAYDSTYGSSEQRAAAVAQFNEIKPTVIAVMNESFTDLSCFEQLKAAGYFGPNYYNSLPDTLVRGTMLASVTGGGTANSEFEFLTGATTAFVGVGKIPYQLYQMSDVDSLAKDLKELGYVATAMHPQNPVNYHRDKIYQQLGFGEFLSINDFGDAPYYHNGVCDYVTYDKILELLRTDERPQFIFDVTMQNHGGYEIGSVPAEELTNYWVEGASENTNAMLNTYLTCINASDRDLEYFINELRNIGRPVVLVFFGDHQPSIATSLNDELYPQEDTASHAFRVHQSTYFVWANYEIAGNNELNVYDTVGANEIAAIALNKIGAPLTDYQKALLATRSDVPSINVAGYLGADGLRYDLESEDSPYTSTIDKLQRVQYLEFATKVQ